jgi:hypothetical protein
MPESERSTEFERLGLTCFVRLGSNFVIFLWSDILKDAYNSFNSKSVFVGNGCVHVLLLCISACLRWSILQNRSEATVSYFPPSCLNVVMSLHLCVCASLT